MHVHVFATMALLHAIRAVSSVGYTQQNLLVMIAILSICHGVIVIGHVNNILTQCNFSLEFPEILTQNHICYQ